MASAVRKAHTTVTVGCDSNDTMATAAKSATATPSPSKICISGFTDVMICSANSANMPEPR
jgi:hypothetical protein